MHFGLTQRTIEQIQNIFQRYPAISHAILYGSRAKGNYKPGSDIDLTLHGQDLDHKLLLQILVELDDLLLPYLIDLSIYADIANPNLKEHIDRVGVIFYIRPNSLSFA